MGSMGLVKPTNHGSADVWDVILSTLFDLVEEHDHTTGKGVKIPSAALRVNADVPWSDSGSSYAITGAKAFDFTPSAPAGMASYAGALFLSDGTSGTTANELYWRTTGGTNVQLTSGASLNVTAFVGGIGGDYSSISALVDYDDASDTYRFRQQTSAGVRQFAKMSAADVRLFEYFAAGASPVPSNSVTLKSPAALAASYSVTWPAAVPGAAAFLQMSTAGVLSASNTIAQSVTATDFRHTTAQTLLVHGSAAQVGNGVGHARINSGGYSPGFTTAATTARIQYPVQIQAGCVITGYKVFANKSTSSATTLFANISHTQGTTGTSVTDGSGSSNAGNAPGSITLSETGLSVTVAANQAYFVEVSPSGGGTADLLYHVEITFTRP